MPIRVDLPAPVGAEQGEEIAWLHGQRDAFEGLHAVAVGLAQVVDDECGC